MQSRQRYPAVKRCLDVAIAVVALPPVLALLAVAAAGCLVFQGRPVLFTQERVGRHGRPFVVAKLRTMAGAPGDGRAYHERHRVTRYGRLIRLLRVDELPQIWHVLTGTMSLVGPRPLMAAHLAEVRGGGRRHDVRPGLACFAQLELAEHGYLDKHIQVWLDEQYVARMSLRTDLQILWRTAVVPWLARRSARRRYEPRPAGR